MTGLRLLAGADWNAGLAAGAGLTVLFLLCLALRGARAACRAGMAAGGLGVAAGLATGRLAWAAWGLIVAGLWAWVWRSL